MAPVRKGPTGEGEGVVDLLYQLVHQLLAVELFRRYLKPGVSSCEGQRRGELQSPVTEVWEGDCIRPIPTWNTLVGEGVELPQQSQAVLKGGQVVCLCHLPHRPC